ncbi:hypothetical protein [Pseudomonas triticicola]|uniref:hypothetical protein n=1 Tax=Pseudomonas triticicola TaxID=2842345 RepID=UPI003EC0E048
MKKIFKNKTTIINSGGVATYVHKNCFVTNFWDVADWGDHMYFGFFLQETTTEASDSVVIVIPTDIKDGEHVFDEQGKIIDIYRQRGQTIHHGIKNGTGSVHLKFDKQKKSLEVDIINVYIQTNEIGDSLLLNFRGQIDGPAPTS